MKNSVIIKGIQSGIIVVLDDKLDFETLKKDIADKFKNSSKFLGKTDLAISFEGRKLTDEEISEILTIINDNTDLNIVCVIVEDEKKDAVYKKRIEENIKNAISQKQKELEESIKNRYEEEKIKEEKERSIAEKARLKKEREKTEEAIRLAVEEAKGPASKSGLFHVGSLRSGQVLELDRSIIIIGDVNHGANVKSKGNVVVIGTLFGNVHAGCDGDTNAFIIAMDMKPTQIRIGNIIARSSDSVSMQKSEQNSKIAYVDDGNIYIENINKNVIKEINI